MLKNLKTNANKFVALALALIMTLGVVPAQSFTDVFAADSETAKIVDSTVSEFEVIPYEGAYDKEAHPAVEVKGTQNGDVITYSEDGQEFTSTVPEIQTPGQKTIVVKIARDGSEIFKSNPVVAVVSNGVLTAKDIVVTPYEGAYDEEEHYSVEVSGTLDGDKVEYQVDNGAFTETKPVIKTPGSQTIKIRVTRDYYDVYESATVVASVVKAEIDGITVEVYTNVYDKESHPAVTVKGHRVGDKIFYSEDGVTYSEQVPEIQDVGKKEVYVKVQRGDGSNYNDYVTFPVSFEAEVTPADITGIIAEGYKGTYEKGKTDDAIVNVAGTLEGDVVTYSTTKDSGYSNSKPQVTEVKDSGVYYVKIHRSENYADLIIEVPVVIEKAEQTIKFTNTPKYVYYNENNSFTYIASKDNEDSEGTITYTAKESVNGIIVETDGTVTYEKVGKITVVATVAACDNYKKASAEYEIEIKYIAAPAIQMNAAGYLNFYKGDVEIYAADGWLISDESNALGNATWKNKITESKEGKYEGKKVAFKDQDNNITDFQTVDTFYIDTTAAVFDVVFDEKNDGSVAKVINFLTFGICCKKTVTVTVNGNDGENGSGIKTIQLFTYSDDNGADETEVEVAKKVSAKEYVFELSPEFEGVLKVKIDDNLGNSTGKVWVNGTNSNYAEGEKQENPVKLILETVKPVIETIENGEGQYSQDVIFKFKVSDDDSGLASVDVKINGTSYEGFPKVYSNDTKVDSDEFEINTANAIINSDGEYKIQITVADNAGNIIGDSEEEPYAVIGKDQTAPIIKTFEFFKDENCETGIKPEEIGKCVFETSYGYYFNQKMYVKISAEDVRTDEQCATGVSKIGYKLVDKGELFKDVNVIEVDVKNQEYIVVEISERFKGQIYAYAVDQVDNAPVKRGEIDPVKVHENHTTDQGYISLNPESAGYKHPLGIIAETQEQHADEEHAKIIVTTDTDYTTKDGDPLYAENVELDITVKDSYSGIGSFIWKIESAELGKSESGTITVKNDGTLTNDSSDENKSSLVLKDVQEEDKEGNLVTSMSGTLTVSSEVFSSNDVVVSIEVTDRAGNTKKNQENKTIADKTLDLNIDKDLVIVDVKYDDVNYPVDSKKYFKARKATIVIEDRNFDETEVYIDIVNSHGNEQNPMVPDVNNLIWNPVPNQKYSYQTDIIFDSDGDYTFKMSCKDRAKNPSIVTYTGTTPQEFTIDQTLPTVTVSYDNNAARNEKYFKANRTATVTIVEHNFPIDNEGNIDTKRVNITIGATLNGATIAQPEITWKHDVDVHTATIAYAADGDYTFGIEVTDLAGNKNDGVDYGKSVAAKEFTVDTKIDNNGKAIIGGVANGKAYKEVAIPTVEFTDVNLESYELHLYRTQRGERNVDITSLANLRAMVTMDTQTGKGSFDIFKKLSSGLYDQSDDGIYRLTITMTDKAGNTSNVETVNFTINRFGSVYVYSEYLSDLIKDGGKYVRNIDKDLIITEYNPDRLVQDTLHIEITRDGKPIDEVDYDVTPVINNQVSVGESGWYQYQYTLKKSNFAEDGVYKISVSSKDATGNSPENSNYEDQDILFRVDDTVPEITSIVGLEKPIVNAEEKEVKYTIFDVIGLKSIKVYVNGELIQEIKDKALAKDANNYEGSFVLKESKKAHNVKILVEDLAGNITDTSSTEFTSAYTFSPKITVSTNFFVRWYANKLLFWGSIAGFAVVLGAVAFIIVAKRKKEEESN